MLRVRLFKEQRALFKERDRAFLLPLELYINGIGVISAATLRRDASGRNIPLRFLAPGMRGMIWFGFIPSYGYCFD